MEGEVPPEIGEMLQTTPEVIVNPVSEPTIERVNPLEGQSFETPTPAPTPVPIMDPIAYRTHILIRTKYFAAAMEGFMGTNGRLQTEGNLINDPAWRSELLATLDELVLSAEALNMEGIPPENQAIDDWLSQAGPEAATLRENYRLALETGDTAYFQAVADSMTRLINVMAQAQAAMTAAGW
jgi:hypothetical protein